MLNVSTLRTKDQQHRTTGQQQQFLADRDPATVQDLVNVLDLLTIISC